MSLRWGTSVLAVAASMLVACEGGDTASQPRPRSVVVDVDAGAGRVCGELPEEGCPCVGEGFVECRLDPVVEDGEMLCPVGERRCVAGAWGGCGSIRYESPPTPDAPDGVGVVEAAVVTGPTPCSACDPRCFQHLDTPGTVDLTPARAVDLIFAPETGGVIVDRVDQACVAGDATCTRRTRFGPSTGMEWAPTPTNSEGVVRDPADGALVLGVSTSNNFGVWVASMDDGTVSRLDPATGREVARYPSTRPDALNRARPWNEACNWSNLGNCPSRTAVDQNFDAYVANRAFGQQGTVTKYASRLEDCIDRSGDGLIQTSRDNNGNGRIDMATTEFLGVNDECLLWTRAVGGVNAVPRALTIGVAPPGVEAGDVWVGTYNTQFAYRLDPTTGVTRSSRSIAPIYPYGAVADPSGRIWFTSRADNNQTLGRVQGDRSTGVDTTNAFAMASAPPANVISYGIALWTSPDLTQTYIFVADSDRNRIFRYNPTTNTWLVRDFSSFGRYVTPRGLAADETYLWAANWSTWSGWGGGCSNELLRLNLPNLDVLRSYGMPASNCFMGVGASFDGAIWAVAAGGNNAARLAPDRASAITTPSLFVNPYTYSDFVGFGLNYFANPRGSYRFTVDSGTACTRFRWTTLNTTVATPPGTAVQFYVRSSDTTAGLASQTWIGPFTGATINLAAAPGPVPNGRYLEVDVRLSTTDRRTSPRVFEVSATGLCDRWLYDPAGTYVQTYDSTTRCTLTERPVWGNLTFSVGLYPDPPATAVPNTLPPGTSIAFQLRSASTAAALPGTTPVTITVPTATSPIATIASRLMSAGVATGLKFLSVTAVLTPTTDRRTTPTLYNFGVEYRCVAAE